ncbi:MAG: hypothetical protein K2X82_00565 [Gemmataceae bacterium]|nr:hypothetical protein [Gemmataceae bacterium]
MRVRLACRAVAAVVLMTAAAGSAPAADAVADLLGWVPARANSALMIDVDALYRSEVAKKGKWGTDGLPTTGLDSLPASAARVVVAGQTAPGGGPAWEVTVVAPKKRFSEAELAKKYAGTREVIAGRPVFLTKRHGYLTVLPSGAAGAFQPPSRQDAGRWLREATGKVPAGFSPYIRAAAAAVGPDAPVVLAVDTTDVFDPGLVKDRLAKADALKGKAADLGALADLFAGLKGVTLTVRAGDALAGELRLDFGGPAAPLAAVGKPLLLEVLARMGVKADEMDGWAFAVKGEVATLGGPLTQDAADLLLSPYLRPSASALDDDQPAGTDTKDAKAEASVKYFKAVVKISNDTRNSKNSSFEQLAFRFNNAARRVDDMPMLNVDDELLDWGAAMATTFRTLGVAASSTGGLISLAETNKSMSMVTTPNYYTWGGAGGGVGYWGPYGGAWGAAVPTGAYSTAVVDNYSQINNMTALTNQKEMENRMKTWDTIKTATTTVRRKMVKKYGVEF